MAAYDGRFTICHQVTGLEGQVRVQANNICHGQRRILRGSHARVRDVCEFRADGGASDVVGASEVDAVNIDGDFVAGHIDDRCVGVARNCTVIEWTGAELQTRFHIAQ